ncbi:MAG: FecR domain-containing protein [Steroidobacteraceae bacterium]
MIGRLWGLRRPGNAAEWFALRRGGAGPRRERQFRAWLDASPRNAEDYALCELAWEVSGTAAQALAQPRPVPRGALLRRRGLVAAALAATLAVVVPWLWPAGAQTWSTGAGEQRTLLLEDGSHVTLNTRTRIEVRYTRHERALRLLEGEAFFEVARDAARPFMVRTALGSARAVGTRFNVYLHDERLAVTTEEGRVEVAGVDALQGVLVDAGRCAELRHGMARARVAPADLAAALDWRDQRIEVADDSLGGVLRDFSRYTPLPVRAATPAIAALRVSAVLRTGDIAALEATLRGAYGLAIERQGDGFVVVRPGERGGAEH